MLRSPPTGVSITRTRPSTTPAALGKPVIALLAGTRAPRASNASLRRCQILLASARGERAPQIAKALGCDDQTVRNVLRAFEQTGLDVCLTRQSSRPHRPKTKLDAAAHDRLQDLLHESPRRFGKPTSVWTLELAAEVSFAEGIIPEQVSDETIRLALKRLGVSWKRAKQWITSPDPAYARKKGSATG